MDDKEYYTLMNRSNSEVVLQNFLKKKKNLEAIKNKDLNFSESRQGREDNEMLHEKKGDYE